MNVEQTLQLEFLGNTVLDYLWVLGAVLIGLILLKFVAHRLSDLVFRLLPKKDLNLNKEQLHQLIGAPLRWFIMLIVLFVCTDHLEFPEAWNIAPVEEFGLRMILHRTYLMFLCIIITWIALRLVKFAGLYLAERATLTESMADDQIVAFLIEMIKIVVIVVGIFVMMGVVFKVDIAALVAGLGIGGLALALAAKESLENLLASFMIFFDKPFVIGDLVTVNGHTGTVEKIGFRSTRIRTLEKSYLTIPNLQMVNNVLDNLSMRTFRRVKFDIGLTYDTTQEQLESIVREIQALIDDHPHTNQDGEIHFMEFGASSLNIMVLYFIDTMDWSVFLNIKEELNYKIMQIVSKHGAEFAFPTQTIHLENN